jgi:SAM-dependent methyltransferase
MKNSDQTYRPTDYWEKLLDDRFDLQSVGYPSLSLAFNSYLYRAMADSVERGLKRLVPSTDVFGPASILDVGSGTGFWIEFWLAKGTQQITGMDLTAKSVRALEQRYPQLTFYQKDIGEPIQPDMIAAFDFVSAMSIVHHIPSQQRWEQALANLGDAVRPGGFLLLMDPILRYKWWGPPFNDSSNGFPRTIAEHMRVLNQKGVNLEFVTPTITLLANPVDTKSKLEFRLLGKWWALFSRIAQREQATRRIGGLVYAMDRLLSNLNYMPTSKILFCRKVS